MSTPGGRDCGHTCCEYPTDPWHDHRLAPDVCPACETYRDRRDELLAEMDRLNDMVADASGGVLPADETRERGASVPRSGEAT